jgi:hypothetical protein
MPAEVLDLLCAVDKHLLDDAASAEGSGVDLDEIVDHLMTTNYLGGPLFSHPGYLGIRKVLPNG